MQSFPCISFGGAYAVPKYLPDNHAVYQSLGLYQRMSSHCLQLIDLLARVFLLYVFDSQDVNAILDRSGNAVDGVLGKILHWDVLNDTKQDQQTLMAP